MYRMSGLSINFKNKSKTLASGSKIAGRSRKLYNVPTKLAKHKQRNKRNSEKNKVRHSSNWGVKTTALILGYVVSSLDSKC